LTNGNMSFEVEQVVGNDDFVFVLSRPRYEHEGRVLDTPICTVCRMQDGKIVELRDLPCDSVAMDEFWA
jgi:ketosteroid isomerase-like protein